MYYFYYSVFLLVMPIFNLGFQFFHDETPKYQCKNDTFLCDRDNCIPKSLRCDHHNDCMDFSDEADCDKFLCMEPNYFRCSNSRCISKEFVCNDDNDCEDFSDEKNCKNETLLNGNASCNSNEWQCTDKFCIPFEWVCNDIPDCPDVSDEILGCSSKIPCDGFKCNNGHCIVREWQCDGHDDCRDNSDELNCELLHDKHIHTQDCLIDNRKYLCNDNKTCISLSNICDDKVHCPDKSDEGKFCKNSKFTCDNKFCSHECVLLPLGPRCICPVGYKTIDEHNCKDINECEIFGICDHKCRNTPGSYECYCAKNFILQSDKKSCKADINKAVMIFSMKNEIRAYYPNEDLYVPIVKNLNQVVGIDFDGEFIYWTDIFSEHESIVRAKENGSEKEFIVTLGLGAPEDLAIDWVTGNIYFTDTERQHIGVCTKDGDKCTVLINKDISKPRGIVLHPGYGKMYWSDWGDNAEIARALMDGSNDTSFVSNEIRWPNGLAIDYPNDRLYWADAKLTTLESIKLDGTDRRIILEGVVKHPYAIAVFESNLYWSDWSTRSIQSCDKFTGKNHHTMFKKNNEFIYGLTIYHPSLKSKLKNPCLKAQCSDMCLLSGFSYKCVCKQNRELISDGRTCRDIEKKEMLILTSNNILMEVDHQLLGKHEINIIPAIFNKITATTYNPIDNSLFISDMGEKKLYNLDLYSFTSEILKVTNLGYVNDLDYDYIGNNLYWCDSEKGTIEVINLNTMSQRILLHHMSGEIPESLAIVPNEGIMFVAFKRSNKRESHIDRFYLDGTSRIHSLENGFYGPLSLWFDKDLYRIFIADAGTGNIESTNIEGDDRHGFRYLQTSPISIASLKHDIFWINDNLKEIYWADKMNNGDSNKKILLNIPEVKEKITLNAVTPYNNIPFSACHLNNGNCSHLCFHVQKSIVCSCPIGYILSNDNHTCVNHVNCNKLEFLCPISNHCILKSWRCDGIKHCKLGEDEDNCNNKSIIKNCQLNHFQCNNGECVPHHVVCDKSFDCTDKSDEFNCTNKQHCPNNHFQCFNGKCIIERFVCDGQNDCFEGEDEENCVGNACDKNTDFRCTSGTCIPKSWECDHEYDCPDFSDEHSKCNICSESMFMCTNKKCVDKKFVCNLEDDCGDNSDEEKCEILKNKCKSDEFACTSTNETICLPMVAHCNGTSECLHHEDETNCSNCHVEEFSCTNKKCIPTQWICDNTDDCGDNSDESPDLCLHHISFPTKIIAPCNNGFLCKNGQCIDFNLVCNGKQNCFDGSDEEGNCENSCNNHPCDQICFKTPSGPQCKCKEGFQLLGDGQNCEDINECLIDPPVCSQLCINHPGSYLCDCYDNFILRSDKKSCKALGYPVSFIFTSNNQIRELSKKDNSLKLLYDDDMPKITGLTISHHDNTIIFSIEHTGTIHRLNTTTNKLDTLTNCGRPQKLSIDWSSNNLYYINDDFNSKAIGVCNFELKLCTNLLSIDFHRQISTLTVDSLNKYLFYTLISWWMFNSPSFVLYRTNLDGSDKIELIKSTSGFITGLTCDINKKQLYYIDQHNNKLNRINYDGKFETIITTNLTHPSDLDYFEDHLYFLTSNGKMTTCELYGDAECHTFKLNILSNGLFIINQQSKWPLIKSFCNNHNNICSEFCIPTKQKFRCLCGNGKFISADNECNNDNKRLSNNDNERIFTKNSSLFIKTNDNSIVIISSIVPICLFIIIIISVYYLIRKRRRSQFEVVGLRFQNPSYNLKNNDDDNVKLFIQTNNQDNANLIEYQREENHQEN